MAGLYCDYLTQEQQSTTNMLGAILKQLLEKDGIPDPVRQAFREEKRGLGGRAVQLFDLVKMLKMTITSLPEVFICIDGLDECLQKNRQELLESLRDIIRASPITRVFLSGRPHIRDEVKGYFTLAIMVSITPTIGDIERFLEWRLDKDVTRSAMDGSLRAEIMRVIPRKISQMRVETTSANPPLIGYSLTTESRFLLVSLNIDAVLEEVTISRRRKKLNEMIQGNGLRDAYSATLARINAQKGSKSRLGMEVLMWLSHSERPLNANELCHALGVEIGSIDLDSQNIPAIETLLGCSLGLVIVEASSYIVRLVHYTLQEYLSNNTDLFHNPHGMIAQVCLTYLNFQCIRDLSIIVDHPPPATPLLEYASCYWGTHAERETTESVNRLALRLLDGFDQHISSKILLSLTCDNSDGKFCWINPTGFTGLHGAAYFGIIKTAVALLQMKKWDLNARDLTGKTAILWAAIKGHGAMVKMLLGREDIAPNTADKGGRTPLLWAAGKGFEGIVKMLLEREDVTSSTADQSGRTPLLWAAGKGFEGIVKILLERGDAAPDTADAGGRTPLSWAAGRRWEGTVKMLLERGDVSPNTADISGRTPLFWAAEKGHEGTVKMLLEREDVAPNTTDQDGRTPLMWAAGKGYAGIVMMLLEREDVSPNTADKSGRTPLSWATGNWHGDVVKILLERKDVAPDTADEDGRTPLSWAAQNGNAGIVMRFLEREDVTPDTPDKSGRTPLSWATGNRRGDVVNVVKMFLEREDVAPDTADEDGRTPLSWAAGNGHQSAVMMLLEREDVTPDTADKDCRTPLLWATGNGCKDVVRMLLAREDVTPNTQDGNGRTPLSWAAEYGYDSVVEMLLEREDITSDTADKEGRTPLSWAVEGGDRGIVKALLERGDVSPDTIDKNGQTLLLRAAERGNMSIVKMLRERLSVSQGTTITDLTSQTALAQVSQKGHAGAVKRLLENRDSILQSVGGCCSTKPFPNNPSESSKHPSKRIRRS